MFKLFSHNKSTCIKMLYKRVMLQKNSNVLLVIITQNNTNERKCRERKIIWFNPPCSMNVRTNIGKTYYTIFIYTIYTIYTTFDISCVYYIEMNDGLFDV